MATDTVYIAGLAELQRKLLELPQRVGRNVLRHAVAAGAAVMRDEAKANAPVYQGTVGKDHPAPGTLQKSVYMKYINELSGPERTVYFVGVRHGKARQSVGKSGKNLDAYYFRFVEFGTSKMNAEPFLRPTFDTKKDEAASVIASAISNGITSELSGL
jgi:HK97 gp10 family phage protein